MTWISQVQHVCRRDIVQLRWYLLAYAVCVIALVARVFAQQVDPDSTAAWLGPLLVIVAMFTTALATQSDAAASDRAAWRALPLDSSAVASAKLCLLLCFVAIGLIGQHVALLAFDISLAEHVRLAVRASVAMLTWLMFSALVAAYTRNIRWYLTLVFALPILAVVFSWSAMSLLAGALRGVDDTVVTGALKEFAQNTLGPLRAAVVIAAVALLVLTYTRSVRRWVGASVATLLIYVGFVLQMATSLAGNDVTARPTKAPTQTVHGEVRWRIDVGRSDTVIVAWRRMQADVPPTDRVVLESGTLVLRFSDGSMERVALSNGEYSAVDRTPGANDGNAFMTSSRLVSVVVAEPRQIASTGLTWPAKDSVEHQVSLPLVLSAQRRAEIAAGGVAAWLEGDAKLLASAIAVEASAADGASSSSNGLRLHIYRWRGKAMIASLSAVSAFSRLSEWFDLGDAERGFELSTDGVVRPLFGLSRINSSTVVLPDVSWSATTYVLAGDSRNDQATGDRAVAAIEGSPSRVVIVKWENPRWVRFVTAPSVVESVSLQNRGGWREGTSAKEAIEVRRD